VRVFEQVATFLFASAIHTWSFVAKTSVHGHVPAAFGSQHDVTRGLVDVARNNGCPSSGGDTADTERFKQRDHGPLEHALRQQVW
jgi:hypothetical protein